MKTPADFLNAKQAAKYLGFSYEMTRTMFRLDQIPTVMVGTMRLTTKALLDEWMSDRQPGTGPVKAPNLAFQALPLTAGSPVRDAGGHSWGDGRSTPSQCFAFSFTSTAPGPGGNGGDFRTCRKL